jgi:hypothetical protein
MLGAKHRNIEKAVVEKLEPDKAWLSLDSAIRYLGTQSGWDRNQKLNDPHLPTNISIQLRDALVCGDLNARGRKFHTLRGGIQDPPLHPLEPIPEDFWKSAHIEAYWPLHGEMQRIAAGRYENVVRCGEHEDLHDVRLGRRKVEELWPTSQDDSAKIVFNEAFAEDATGRIPFANLRALAQGYGLNLDHQDAGASNLAYAIEGELKEAAANNRLSVWGRPFQGPVRDNDPLIPIRLSTSRNTHLGTALSITK